MNTSEKILETVQDKFEVKIEEKFDPQEFFKGRDGLYVWSDFRTRILEKAEPVEASKGFELSSFKLLKRASDEVIESSLPEQHLFSESEVCAVVANLITRQSKGEEGLLENTGYANLFYTPAVVVHVHWYGGEWYVYAWYRDVNVWFADYRVFSPATGPSVS